MTEFTRHTPESLGIERNDLESLLRGLPPCNPTGPWLAGGAVRRLIQKTERADIDFFFRSPGQFTEFRAMVAPFATEPPTETKNNTTFRLTDGRKVQAIRVRWYPSADAVIDSFDFTICQFLWDGREVFVGRDSASSLRDRDLVIHKITHPASSARRLHKYEAQGFRALGSERRKLLDAFDGEIPKHGEDVST